MLVLKMAAVDNDTTKGPVENSDVNYRLALSSHLTEHTSTRDTNADDTGASVMCHSVPALKTDAKTGVHVS